ncbi:MAG: ROK family protein [Solirubrobacteraceae bacterium]|nr:ROK family protein [Solirubrobacteraceae bacterium]
MTGTCMIGVDLGGTKLLAGAVDADLQVHARAHRAAQSLTLQEVLDTVVSAIDEVRAAASVEIGGIGLGIPCLMDRARGVAMMSTHLPIAGVPFGDLVAERVGLPVAIDNDANAAMLAEWRAGAAQGARDAVLLTIGTGIGSGMVVEGQLARGAQGAGPELGHMVVDADGPECAGACPNRGCLEAVVSGPALAREGRELAREHADSALGRALASGREITGALVTELAHDGDAAAEKAVRRIGRWLGVGIANVVNIFNPQTVVIGGGVIGAGELLLGPAREVVAARALPPMRDAVQIVPSGFGAESGMLGAALLAREAVGS